MPDPRFATPFEREIIKQLGEKLGRERIKIVDLWCGECGLYAYAVLVDSRPDYMCFRCRLDRPGIMVP